jgi:O-antigen ligase
MLAGASWALLCLLPLVKRWGAKVVIIGVAGMVLYGQALTGGRMGYATWAVLGIVLCILRWRKYLWLTPVAAMCIVLVLPGVRDRLMQGFGEKTVSGQKETNEYEVLSGRLLAWEYVVDKIGSSPVVGYGKQAMVRTGLYDKLWNERKESFPHPHNAYLELLFDTGVIGFLMVIPFYFVVVKWAGSLFLDRANPWCGMVGGVSLSLVLAYLIAGFGSQTFYPREGEFGMWAAMGLMMRLHVERQRAAAHSYGGLPYGSMPLSDGALRYSS